MSRSPREIEPKKWWSMRGLFGGVLIDWWCHDGEPKTLTLTVINRHERKVQSWEGRKRERETKIKVTISNSKFELVDHW